MSAESSVIDDSMDEPRVSKVSFVKGKGSELEALKKEAQVVFARNKYILFFFNCIRSVLRLDWRPQPMIEKLRRNKLLHQNLKRI